MGIAKHPRVRDPLQRVSVGAKIALMFVSICLLAFGVGGWIVSDSAKSALEKEIRQRLDLHSRAFATALDAGIRTLSARTRDFASDGYIRSHLDRLLGNPTGPSADADRTELLRHLAENKLPIVPAFTDLALAGPDGAVIMTCSRADGPATREVAAQAAREPGLWHGNLVVRDEARAIPELAIATPLLAVDGRREIGRLIAWIHPGIWAASALEAADLGRADDDARVELGLVDRAGRLLRLPRAFTDASPPAPDSEIVRSGFGLRVEPAAGADPDARRFPIGALGWSARVERLGGNDLSAVAGLQSRFLFVGAALTLLAALLLFFPLRFLARPLARLKDAAARVREGDYRVRVDVESQDEIGALAQTFNHMAAAVEERTRRLEAAAEDLRARKTELRKESERLHAVISSMRDALVVLDADGTPVLRNAAARPLEALFEAAGAKSARAHHSCHDAEPAGDCARCLLDPAQPPRTCVLDLGRSVYEIHATRLAPDETGRAGRVMVARDVTDRTAQEERQTHQERLAVLGEVASVMAHELNNPLAAISMFAQLADADLPSDSPLRENLAVIRRNTESCKRAIRELLDYATDATPEIVPVDVHATLEDTARFLRPVRERAGVALEIDAAARAAEVTGDEVQLRQIFVNLLVNAFQAMEGRGGTVRVRTRNRGDHLEIDVADEGPGVAPDVREAIFKPFFTTKPRGEGTGLGLPTARRIAELHGGSLDLAETGPGGSTFRVRLRLARSPEGTAPGDRVPGDRIPSGSGAEPIGTAPVRDARPGPAEIAV